MRTCGWTRAIPVAALAIAASAPAIAQTRTYTTNADFDAGYLNNTQHNPADQLVLGRTPVSKTTLVWATNYLYGWVVRIDSTTGKQTSRFDSSLQFINGQATGAPPPTEYCDFASTGNCPGRVAVDTNGDVWIVNRAFGKQGTLSKFSGNIGHCIDRNNNGVIDTSFDKNGDGTISVVGADGEYFGQNDECILTTIKIGPVNVWPRGVAVDKKGKIWVSTFNDGKIYRYNPNEPVALEATVDLGAGANPYSLASGGDYVFASNRGAGGLKRVHIDTLTVDSNPACGVLTYGVVGDPAGNVAWFGGYGGDGVFRADFSNNTCQKTATGGCTTAVTLDLDGNVWAANYCNHTVHKVSPAGVLLGTYAAGGTSPHGMSVDFQGNIWVITHGPPAATKINSATGAIIGTYGLGGAGVPNADPYLYSDFTGVQIDRLAPYTRVGAWDTVYDSGAVGMPWQQIWWNSEPQGAVPSETSLVISARAGDTMAALGQAAYKQFGNGAALTGTLGRYIQVKADLVGPGYKTPVLSDLNIKGPCDVINQSCCIKGADCDDGDVCTADICATPGGACTHQAIPQCCVADTDCNDGNQCTTDTCPAPGAQCAHAQLANCCMSYADCDDGDLCTADVCPSPGGVCGNPTIPGCCHTTADCDDGNTCTVDACPADGELCAHTPIAQCCTVDADCTDNNLCTTDACDPGTLSCTNVAIADCCNEDSECFDGNVCTTDRCSGLGGQCVFDTKADCCTDTSPEVGQPCDEPVAPNNHAPCKPGQWACVANGLVCQGAVKPAPESCDWVDNDCDGNIDAPDACPVGKTCMNGVCVVPCGTGEFPCDAGFQCVNGLCIPTSCDEVICQDGYSCVTGQCVSGDGGTGGAGGTGAGGMGGVGGSGIGGQGAFAGMGGGGAGQDGGVKPDSGAGGGGASSGNPDEQGRYGLTTGGGGCKCNVAGADSHLPRSLAGVGLALFLAGAARRRRRRA